MNITICFCWMQKMGRVERNSCQGQTACRTWHLVALLPWHPFLYLRLPSMYSKSLESSSHRKPHKAMLCKLRAVIQWLVSITATDLLAASLLITSLAVQAQRRSREQSRSASALSISGGEEKSEHSEGANHYLSTYSEGGIFSTTSTGTSPWCWPRELAHEAYR